MQCNPNISVKVFKTGNRPPPPPFKQILLSLLVSVRALKLCVNALATSHTHKCTHILSCVVCVHFGITHTVVCCVCSLCHQCLAVYDRQHVLVGVVWMGVTYTHILSLTHTHKHTTGRLQIAGCKDEGTCNKIVRPPPPRPLVECRASLSPERQRCTQPQFATKKSWSRTCGALSQVVGGCGAYSLLLGFSSAEVLLDFCMQKDFCRSNPSS
jgi:hypothetical protein